MTTPTRTHRSLAARLPAATAAALTALVATCLVVGLLAAVVGGSASRAGSGPGGLGGVPQLALLAVLVLLALPSAVVLRRRPAHALLLLGGAVVVAFGYFFFGHAVDPCATGMLDPSAAVGNARLCETGSYGTSTSERFHLLEHALAASLLLGGYLLALRAAGVVPAAHAARDDR